MGKVIIQEFTPKNPITMIGQMAGVCWGANTTDPEKNYKRGISCIENQHGRTWEFPDIYAVLDGYSCRVMREWYTHIGGAPTRLQASTRYIDYDSFNYITPPSIQSNETAKDLYDNLMNTIKTTYKSLEDLNIPREDIGMVLPLATDTKVADKRNFRNVVDMAHQRLCKRAYWEYRDNLFKDYIDALRNYSEEWKTLCDMLIVPKCKFLKYCPEKNGCNKNKQQDVIKSAEFVTQCIDIFSDFCNIRNKKQIIKLFREKGINKYLMENYVELSALTDQQLYDKIESMLNA